MADCDLCGTFELVDACEVKGTCCCADEEHVNEIDELLGVV